MPLQIINRLDYTKYEMNKFSVILDVELRRNEAIDGALIHLCLFFGQQGG